MPTVKLSWNETPEKLEKYLAKDRDGETITTASDGLDEKMAAQIRSEHLKHNKNVQNKAFEIIQAWSPEESHLMTPEKYNEMGLELAKRLAPGHKSWVVTHTDKEHIHNHIVICTVHSESGKIHKNKRANFYRMHDLNNEIAKEKGFGHNHIKGRNPNKVWAPPRAKDMEVRGRKTYYYDMLQKADFARAASTSFDEYVGLLKTRGVHVRVENDNIVYQYGKTAKSIRGKRIHEQYSNEGLMKAFKENDERFNKTPGLKERIRGDIDAAFDRKGNFVGTQSDILLESTRNSRVREKNYSQYTKIDRTNTRSELPAIFDRNGGPLYSEMKKASQKSIFEYCKENKIQLIENKNGQKVMRGREFVEIEDKYWINTKSGREGNIIDFVMATKETTELRAVAHLNNNPRLLLLEPYLGSYMKGTRPFYVPKFKSPLEAGSEKAVHKFLSSRGYSRSQTSQLLKSNSIKVGEDFSIWLLGDNKESALEYKEDSKGEWKAKIHGKRSPSFLESVTLSNKLIVHQNIFDFLLNDNSSRHSKENSRHNLFVMFDESSMKRLHEFLTINHHIDEVLVMKPDNEKNTVRNKQTVQELKRSFDPFSIQLKEISTTDLVQDRNRGPDISI